jgi:hypothetical protein
MNKRKNKNKSKGERKEESESGTEPENAAEFGSDYVAVYITGGVHAIPDVSVEPETVLTRWSLRQVIDLGGKRSRHLVGWADFEGRVCSSIVSLDLASLHVITESGRLYHLAGPPGYDSDAEYVFARWLKRSGRTRPKDLTRSLLRLRATRGLANLN